MRGPVIELVRFRLRAGIDEETFLAAADDTARFLEGCAGFRRRRLGRADDGQWLDHVEWCSMADALDAAAQIGESPLAAAFLAAIDPSTVILRHFAVRSAAG